MTAKTQMLVRLPTDLKAWLAARAADNLRSMNAEIVHMLQTAMKTEAAKETK